jgi:hemerythrin
MRARRGNEAMGAAIEELVAYVRDHFSNEETLMADNSYPELDAHMKKHNEFVTKINEFQMAFNNGKSALTIDIMNFLKDWLVTHIKGTDRQYGSLIAEKETVSRSHKPTTASSPWRCGFSIGSLNVNSIAG